MALLEERDPFRRDLMIRIANRVAEERQKEREEQATLIINRLGESFKK